MERNDKHIEQELDAALGTPRYYMDAEGKKEGERYFWFPTQGDSMTNNTDQSIPAGSMVLGRLLSLNSIQDLPLNRPIVLIIDDGGQQFCMLKSACNVVTDTGSEKLCLHSYNSRYNDFWLPWNCIKFIFEVERIRRSDGSEFVPRSAD